MWSSSGRRWSPGATPGWASPISSPPAPTRRCTSPSENLLVSALPDATGHFDRFGGKFVPEALHAALQELEREFAAATADPSFGAELAALLADYTGRPSPITEAKRFAAHAAGDPILVLKR